MKAFKFLYMNNKKNIILTKIISKLSILLINLMGKLPLSLRIKIGRVLGKTIALFNFRDKVIAELQIKFFLKNSNPNIIISNLFAHFGEMVLETINLNPILNNPEKYIECPQLEYIKSIPNQSRPYVTLTSHLGNWELLAAYVVKAGIPLITVARQARNQIAQNILESIRDYYGVKSMWKQDRSSLREMVRHFKPGNVIASLIDQDTDVRSENIPFIGVPAKTPLGLIEIGKRYNAIFLTAFIRKDKKSGKHIINVEEIPDDKSIEEILQIYNERLEKEILVAPEQWPWVHKRWRSGFIENRTLSSREYIKYLEEQLK